MTRTQGLGSISTRLRWIAELARKQPETSFTSLAHLIDVDWLREAYRRTRKDGAAGVDRQTAWEYAANLEDNLQSLLERFKAGTYHAPPVRRVHIPKGDGSKTRPIGIPTFEDKVLQRAVAMALEAIYEQDFLNCSYGFRPRRSAHQALHALREQMMRMRGGVVLDMDIQGFFDTLDHSSLRSFLDRRVRDGVLRRVIHKWLKAGVMEDGRLSRPETGTPQGGVISPILANLYLHEVLDRWFEEVVRPRMEAPAFMVRYADDAVLVFRSQRDAERVMDVLAKRLGRFGLTLHPEKTRLVPFGRPRAGAKRLTRDERPGTFDFLGFTHFWAKSRRGYWVVKQKTSRGRFSRALRRLRDWLRRVRHFPIAAQHRMLCRKVRGHYNYYGIVGNAGSLARFGYEVVKAWKKWLGRRSHRAGMSWEKFLALLLRYPLPPPRVRRSLPRAANG